ncbi:hypothetical protein CARUB_v10007177mg [Capsella rubella]|uniref:Phorbol-ester/DAG-type domain-containing protein n=1 Tax=Capsella rubella TaxID=81985 RepID=R0GP08_9BRAS|nr:uncharacterized protein LOC17878448 [Capsella rubella]EOA18604.1 hypothetical protein CARUB_v10007177mg [Capsella rubella]
MESVKLPIHKHPLLPITRFSSRRGGCNGCGSKGYIYGGYRCNELGCETPTFHRDCAESLPEIKHSSHPHHPLKLSLNNKVSACNQCGIHLVKERWIYICLICDDFKLDLYCAKGAVHLHEHPLQLFDVWSSSKRVRRRECKTCNSPLFYGKLCYVCYQCKEVFHEECVEFFPEANHSSHPQHPLKLLTFEEAPSYIDEKCLLCEEKFDQSLSKEVSLHTLHHCDVCNFSICTTCMKNPPPVRVVSLTTHEHQLHLVPRRIDFTCNACGTLGGYSPYFCVQCNFMIHRQCIDLPRVININRHDHRISYTTRLGHGKSCICKVCRKNVDGFYGAYTCVKCPSFAVHSRCATREDVWDMIELEGMPEEEEIAPFEVIDDNTIKHFSHDHTLQINKDGHGQIQPENVVCEACVLQILSEPFYSCKQCNFILHEKCANHPRKKRHVYNNLPFTLLISDGDVYQCWLCLQEFTGFRYKSSLNSRILDVRCAAISDTLEHKSHQHSLYYYSTTYTHCNGCGKKRSAYRCDECEYSLDNQCAFLPNKVMRIRYDDHPLVLSFGDTNVASEYWCEACETKVNPKEWFYTCNDCGTTLHVSCVVGDFSYIMLGSRSSLYKNTKVVSNNSCCRPFCFVCNSKCMLPSILKLSKAGVDVYVCSFKCRREFYQRKVIKV